MVRILTALFAFFTLPAHAIYQPQQSVFIACGVPVPLPNGITLPGPGVTSNSLIELACRATGANTYCSARRANGTQGYTITTGKTFKEFYSCVNPGSTSTDTGWAMCYGSSDVGFASASAPSAASWAFNDQNNSQVNAGIFASAVSPGKLMDFNIPSGKIPCAQTNASAYIWIYGYEY